MTNDPSTRQDETLAPSTAPSTAIVPASPKPVNNRLIRLPDADPPEQIATLAGEYIGLSIAGGLVLGLLVGSLIPRAPGKKLSRRASALAAIAGEVALLLAKQALDHAGETAQQAKQSARNGREKWHKTSDRLGEAARATTAQSREAAGRVATEASKIARQSASKLAKKAIDRLTKTGG